jgi:hypothetical protein
MGQDFSFDTFELYHDAVRLNTTNVSVSTNTSVDVNATLWAFDMSTSDGSDVIMIEANASAPANVTFEVELPDPGDGDFTLKRDGSDVETVSSSGIFTWSYDAWDANHTHTITYNAGSNNNNGGGGGSGGSSGGGGGGGGGGGSFGGSTSTTLNVTATQADGKTQVTVTDAPSNESFTANVSADVDSGTGVREVQMRLADGGDGTVNLSSGDGGSAAFGHVGQRFLDRIRIAHDVEDQLADGSLQVVLPQDAVDVNDTHPQEVLFYEKAGGAWTPVTTQFTGENGSDYVYDVDNQDLDDLAVVADQKHVIVTGVSVQNRSLHPGKPVVVTANVSNRGYSDGSATIQLFVDQEQVAEQTVAVSRNTSRQVRFNYSVERTGSYTLAVNNRGAGSITVDAPEQEQTEPADDTNLLLMLAVLVVVLGLAGTAFYFRGTIREHVAALTTSSPDRHDLQRDG